MKYPPTNLTPIVRTTKYIMNKNNMQTMTQVFGYAYCKVCNALLHAHCGNWAKYGLKCPNCATLTWYVVKEWRGIETVNIDTFDLTKYTTDAKPVTEIAKPVVNTTDKLLQTIIDRLDTIINLWTS